MSPLFTMLLWNTSLAGGLALVVYLVQRFQWPKCHPSLWYFLWILVLLKLIVPAVFTVPVALESHALATPSGEAMAMNLGLDPSIVIQDDMAVDSLTSAVWIPQFAIALSVFGTIAVLVLGLIRNRRIARLVRLANPGPPQLQELTESLAREIGIGRPVTLLGVDGCVSPFLYVRKHGLVILAPLELIARFEKDSLRLIIKHELMHYARRDHWTNAFSTMVVAILWWNPVAWWARREMRFVQELCCDAAVLLSDTGQRRRYAETLLQTVDFVASEDSTLPAPATAFGSCKTFKRRIEMISRKDLSSRAPFVTRLFILTMGALLVATSPTFAHDEEERDDALAQARQEIRELRESVKDLKYVIEELNKDKIAKLRAEGREKRGADDDRIGKEQLTKLAQRAELDDHETLALYGLAESVNFDLPRIERLVFRDDLSEIQFSAIKKLTSLGEERRDRDSDEDVGREDRVEKLSQEQLKKLSQRARLSDRETIAFLGLAESVNFDPRRIERLVYRDDLSEIQWSAVKKLASPEGQESDRRGERREEGDERARKVSQEQLREFARDAGLNERETDAFFERAESVNFDRRRLEHLIERLATSDDISDVEMSAVKKLLSVAEDGEHRREVDRREEK